MQFYHLLFLLVITLFSCVRTLGADLITTYREFKVVKTPSESPTDNDNRDVAFYVDANEHLETLKAEAEELRDAYKEMVTNAFGHELLKNRTRIITTKAGAAATAKATTEDPLVGGARKASADWVRATINPILSHNQQPPTNSNKTYPD